ncbi:MAG: hypothetical protein KF821_09050 [Anaerolineales bacterium]|nr:hypothetical protein [Anaerolineales bacterium]
MTELKVTVDTKEAGLMLLKMPQALGRAAELAGKEFGDVVLDTEGLREYPPSTAANEAPPPYYKRGVGMQYAQGKNDMRSERYGSSYRTSARGYRTEIVNTTSYGPHLGGQKQARRMAALGWRKLYDVAMEKKEQAQRIYSAWIERTLKQLGFK